MDGYEFYAYNNKFLKKLAPEICGRISQQTLYVDSFDYKQTRIRKKFLEAPQSYLSYLTNLMYNRYYKYLSDDKNETISDMLVNGQFNGEDLTDSIIKLELTIAQINSVLNPYYAINLMKIFDVDNCEMLSSRIYEPIAGSKIITNREDLEEYKRKLKL